MNDVSAQKKDPLSKSTHPGIWSLILIAAVMSILGYSLISTNRIVENHEPLVDILAEVKYHVTTAYLSFEDALRDRSPESHVLFIEHIQQAERQLLVMIKGCRAKHGNAVSQKDASVISDLGDVTSAIQAFRVGAEKHWAAHTGGRDAPEASKQTEALFRRTIWNIDVMDGALRLSGKRDIRNFRVMQGAMIAITVVLSALVTIILHLYERQKRRDLVALRQSEKKYRSFFENSSDAMLIIEGEKFIDCNAATASMLGYSDREALLNTQPSELSPEFQPDGRSSYEKAAELMTLAKEKGSHRFEWMHKRRDGEVFPVEVSLTAIESRGGIQLHTLWRDLTERKQMENALRESEERYRLLIESQTDLVVKVDPDGRFLFVSPSYCRMFDKREEELLGRTFMPLVHEDDRVSTEEAMKALFAPPHEAYLEQRAKTKDGWRWLAWQDTAILDNEGNVKAIIGVGRDITARKEAEQALSESEARYRSLVESTSDWIWELDAEGRFSYASPQVEAMLGYTPEELIGKSPFDLMAPEEADRVREIFGKLQADSEAIIRMENVNLHREGREVVLETSGIPILDPDGRVVGYRGVDRDITDRKKADEALKASLQKLALHVEQTPLGVVGWNNEFEVAEWNPAAEKIFGYSREEALGRHASFIVPEAVRDQVAPVLQKLQTNTGGARSTNENITKTGDRILCEWYNTSLVDDSGEVIGAASLVMDVSARKKAQEERERLTLAIEQSAEMVLITDADAHILYVNPAFERVTGYTRDEVLGQNPNLLQSGQHTAAFYSKMWHRISSGKSWSGQLINRRKDGSIYTEDATISPVTDELGKIINYVAAKHDATHELELEDQLRQAQKIEAVGQMAGGIAHDFNNLLQVISGYVELTEMTMDEKDPHSLAIEEIGKAALRGKGLINQLLAFSRRQVIKPLDLDLNALITPILNMIHGLIGEHITLDFIQGHGLGTIHADRGLIEQVLMNLCANARDAMPQGGKLTIETENVLIDSEYAETHSWATPGRYVLLSVTDTGSGMEARTLEHIFEPFFTTKEVGKGTGLGLSTVFGIIKQHDGHINAYSEVGKGTIFKIYLPAVERKATEVSRTVPGPVIGGNETILIAEDDETVLRLAEHLLTRAGYRVLTAMDGEEAIAVFKKHIKEIDVVMFDVVMPRMGGKEAIEKLLELRPGLPHLFASGYSENAVHTNFIQKRGLHLLSKPYQAETLLRKIREVLDNV